MASIDDSYNDAMFGKNLSVYSHDSTIMSINNNAAIQLGGVGMKPSYRLEISVDARPSLEQLAHMVAHLGSDEHARLISLIAKITQSPEYSEAMQLQAITDDPSLTTGGRRLMEQIGNYARPLPSGEMQP